MSTVSPPEAILQDEIERLRTRVAGLERERQIPKEIIEKSPVMVSIVRAPDFIYELVNPAFQALAPGKEFLGRRFADVWAEVSEPLVGILQSVIDTGRTFNLEDAPYTIQRGPGAPPEVVYVSYSWIPLPGPDGQPDRILTLALETTAAVRQRQEMAESHKSLRDNEAVLRSFFDSAGMMRGFVELVAGRIVHVSCNAAAAKMYGVDRDSVPGKDGSETGAPDEVLKAWVGLYEDSRRTGKPVSMEYARRDAGGQDRWLLATASYLGAQPSGSPRFAYTILDLTDRKRAEEALHRQRQWLEVTLQSIGDAVLATGADGRITFLNPVAARLTGWTEARALGLPAGDVLRTIDEQTREKAEDIIGRVLRDGCVVTMANHTALVARDGREIPIEDSAAPIRDGAGSVLGVVLVFHDVTEKRRAHRELQIVLNSISDGLLVLDRNWRYTYFSEQGARMIGMRREDLIGGSVWELFPHAKGTKFYEGYHRAVETGQPVTFEEYYPEPLNKWFECHCYPSEAGLSVYFHDISVRKRAEEALRESMRRERFLAGILETSEQPFAIGYPDGRLGICNRAYCELTGYSLDELQSISWTTQLTPADWVEKEMALLARLERTGKPVRYEKEYVKKDGRRMPVEKLVHAVRDESGKVEFYYSFLTDITERRRISESLQRSRDELDLRVRERTRELSSANETLSKQIQERERAQAALHQSELAFRTLAESVPQLVWICNPDGLNVYFNQRWVEYTGLTLEESYGRGWNTPFHPDDLPAAWQAWNRAVQSGDTYRIESRLRRADGTYHWFLIRGVPSREATGQIVKWFGTCTDVDDLKQAEQAARSARERLALSMKVGQSGAFEWDIPNNVNIWTTELEELYGLPPGTFGGRYEDWEAMLLPEDLAHVRACLEGSLKTGEFSSEWRFRRAGDGQIRWIVAHAKVFFDQQGRPLRMIGFNRDITDRKQAEQEVLCLNQDLERRVAERTIQLERTAAELEKRNREVERVNQMKTEFLARSSHELRTPLNAIVGYSDLLSEQSAGPLPPPYPRFVSNIQEGARHLVDMVNDLLDLSRIEAGRIELNLERLDISAVLDEVLSVITPLAEIKSISLENRMARGTAVVADRVRFRQILYNLMSNAVKFTPEEGRVWIEAATDGEVFTICVGDTGIGIAPGEQEAIFEEFHQVASAGKLAQPGAGLGLAITRKLARLHGGDVRVESELGKGSRFLVSLPVSGESNEKENGGQCPRSW